MKRPKKSRKPRDLWGAAQSTSMSAKLLVTSSAPLISIQPGTSLVIDGERVTVESIQKGDGRFTITAKADES